MTEQGSQDKRLARIGSQDIVPPPNHESLDLTTARLVLETLVGIHENTLTETSDLTKVGKYDTNCIRKALNLVSQEILNTHQNELLLLGTSTTRKQTAYGKLSLTVFQKLDKNLKPSEPESLYMSLTQGNNFVLESQVPLIETSSWTQISIRFSDFRQGINVTSMYDMKDGFSIDKYRHIWRGMRWLSANMLDWDGKFKLPEDLDQTVLPRKTTF